MQNLKVLIFFFIQLSKKGRKNIRKVKKKEDLSELTQSALKEEELRKKRIEKRQKEVDIILT